MLHDFDQSTVASKSTAKSREWYDGAGLESNGNFWEDDEREEDEDDDDDDDQQGQQTQTLPFSKRMKRTFQPIIDFYKPFSLQERNEFAYSPSSAEEDIKELYFEIRRGALILSVVSAFFWGWAVLNTVKMQSGQDLGIYSFFTAFLSSHYVLFRTKNGPQGGTFVATTMTRVLVTSSHVLVTLNYGLGVLFALNVGTTIYYEFLTYCVVATVLWGYVSYRAYFLFIDLQNCEIEIARGEDDYYDDDYF